MYRFTVYKRIYKFFYPSIVDDESTTQQKKKKLLSVEESNSKGGKESAKGGQKKGGEPEKRSEGGKRGGSKFTMMDACQTSRRSLLKSCCRRTVIFSFFSYPSTFCLVSRWKGKKKKMKRNQTNAALFQTVSLQQHANMNSWPAESLSWFLWFPRQDIKTWIQQYYTGL